MIKLVTQIAICIFLTLCRSTEARAGAIGCYDGLFFPRDGSVVPENLPGILFWPTDDRIRYDDDDAGVEIEDEIALFQFDSADRASPVPFTLQGDSPPYLVIPDEGFRSGMRYQIWTRGCGVEKLPQEIPTGRIYFESGQAERVPYATLSVTDAAVLPTKLPTLKMSESVREVVAYNGDCSGCGGPYDVVSVYAELTMDAGPWADALAYTTLVDSETYHPSPYYKFPTVYGMSWVGHGRDRLSAICEQTNTTILAEGKHEVKLVATIPGFDFELSTNTVVFTLDCGTDIETSSTESGTYSNETREGGLDTTLFNEESKQKNLDASVSNGESSRGDFDADTDETAVTHHSRRGCAVASPGKETHNSGSLLLLWLVFVFWRRRRNTNGRAVDSR